jgi:endonuclease V-like protein UPF0215 family
MKRRPKRETRILGLVSCPRQNSQRLVVGTIFRGNKWLDGLLAKAIDIRSDYVSDLAHAIAETRQYSQLRVIITREALFPAGQLDLCNLSKSTHRPIIAITKVSRKRITPRSKNEICIRKRRRYLAAQVFGLNTELARELLLVGCTEQSPIPEALRVAEMIAAKL